MSDINDTIREREARYGSFEDVACVSQRLKEICRNEHDRSHFFGWNRLHSEGIDMICHKLARIVCGDPNYADSWHDLGGFAIRVAQLLENKEADNGNGNEAKATSY